MLNTFELDDDANATSNAKYAVLPRAAHPYKQRLFAVAIFDFLDFYSPLVSAQH